MSDRIATVIAEAAEAYFQALERDGYRPEGCSGADASAAILAALKAARIAVVPLPEGVRENNDNGDWWTDFPGVGLYVPVVFDGYPDEVQIRAGAWCDEPLSVTEAQELAASILAAADAAAVGARITVEEQP